MAMSRTVTLRTLGLLLALGASAPAGDDGPDLAAPTDVPPVVEAPDSGPEFRADPKPPISRSAPLPPPEATADGPTLLGPVEMQAPSPGGTSPGRPSPGGGGSRPLTLETVPPEGLGPEFREMPAEPPSRSGRGASGPKTLMRSRKPGKGQAVLAPKGRGRGGDSDESVIIESKSDPAADAALKRRLERQIRQALGDRVRSVEVLVVDRRVVIQAKTARFWQRRAVRKSIEGLPDLVGYRSTIYVDE